MCLNKYIFLKKLKLIVVCFIFVFASYLNSKCPPGKAYSPLPCDPFLWPSIIQLGWSGEVTNTPTPTATPRPALSVMFFLWREILFGGHV